MSASTGARGRGFSLLELVVSVGAAAGLVVGMAAAVGLGARALDETAISPLLERRAAAAARLVAGDARYAEAATVSGNAALSLTLADRTGDGQTDTVAYAWDADTGRRLTLTENGLNGPVAENDLGGFEVEPRVRTLVGTGFGGHLTDRFTLTYFISALGPNPIMPLPTPVQYDEVTFAVVAFDDRFQDPPVISVTTPAGMSVVESTTKRVRLFGSNTFGTTTITLGLDTTGPWTIGYEISRDGTEIAAGTINGTGSAAGLPLPALPGDLDDFLDDLLGAGGN